VVAAFALGRTLHFAHSSVLYCVCCKILFGWYDLMRARESETGVSDSCLALGRNAACALIYECGILFGGAREMPCA
jgi:hypothetical protein